MDKEIILKTGNKLTFQYAQFEVQMVLLNVATEEIKKVDINATDSNALSSSLIKLVTIAMASNEMNSIFWRCANTCLYNGERITQKTFESIDARKDYLEIKYHIFKENLSIFFSSLFGELKAQENLGGDAIQKMMQSLVSK